MVWSWPAGLALWKDFAPHLKALLQSDEVLVLANGAFDALSSMTMDDDLVPLWHAKYLRGQVRDILLEVKLVDIAMGHYERIDSSKGGPGWSLDSCYHRATHQHLEKNAWRKHYGSLDGVPLEHWPQGALEYPVKDAAVLETVLAWNEARADKLRAKGIEPIGHFGARLAIRSLTLSRASCWGVLTDRARTEELAKEVETQIRELVTGVPEETLQKQIADEHLDEAQAQARREGLFRAGLVRKDLTRNAKAATELCIASFRKLGLPAPLSKTGEAELAASKRLGLPEAVVRADLERNGKGISVDKDASILSQNEHLIQYAAYTGAGLLHGRIDRMREGYDYPLCTRFDPLKETGRTSSTQPGPDSGLVGEQMQNFGARGLGARLRHSFTPRAGNLFFWADLSMAELHSFSEVAYKLFGFSRMGELLNAGIDLHTYFGARSIGISYEEARALGKAFKTHRNRAKPLNFGVIGGIGVEKIILYSRKGFGVRFTRDEVQKLRQLWLATFPEARLYLKWIGDQGEAFTHIHPITGYVRGGCTYTNGANQGFQHLTATAFCDAMVAADLECFDARSPLWGCRLVNEIHDELVFEGPAYRAEAACVRLGEIMEQYFNAWHMRFSTHVEKACGHVWTKADLPFDVDGRRMAWAV